MTLRFVLVLAILLFSGCDVSDEEAKALRSAARNGQIPATLSSLEAAVTYKNATFAGGKIDEIRLGLSKYIVIFIHGSGVPVVEIAVVPQKYMALGTDVGAPTANLRILERSGVPRQDCHRCAGFDSNLAAL